MKSLFWLCLLVCTGLAKRPVVLTDENFEHDTQAATGSTTGDWFIMFCNDRFKLCRDVQPVWEEVSGVLFGKINVASVSLPHNEKLQERFYIGHNEVPYVIYMRKSRIYVYHNNDWNVDSLVDFAIDHYPRAEQQGKVPVLSGFWDEVKHFWNQEVEQKGGALHVMLMMDSNKQIWFSALLLVYGLPLITVYIFYLIMKSSFKTEDNIADKIKAVEQHNEETKRQMRVWVSKHPAMQRRRRKWE